MMLEEWFADYDEAIMWGNKMALEYGHKVTVISVTNPAGITMYGVVPAE